LPRPRYDVSPAGFLYALVRDVAHGCRSLLGWIELAAAFAKILRANKPMTLWAGRARSFDDRGLPFLAGGPPRSARAFFRNMPAQDILILASCGVVIAGMTIWIIWLGRHVK